MTVRPSLRPTTAPALVLARAVASLVLILSGCWHFHRGPTPQEQYYSALARGDAITATQIWMKMSPKDRAKLLRGEGLSQEFKRKQFEQQLKAYATSIGMPGAIPAERVIKENK